MSETVSLKQRAYLSNNQLMAWLVCLSAGLFFFYEFFQLNLFDVINEPLRADFNVNAAQLSWMSSTYLWADILFLIPAGYILDRFSTRLVILTSMFICILGTIGFGITHSFALACFFHFLSGIGNAFCFLSCVVLVSRWFPPRRQALVIGCLVTMAFLGGMMAHAPLEYLNQHYGWRKALLIDGEIGILLFVWIWFFVKNKPQSAVSASVNTVKKPTLEAFLSPLKNKQNWYAGIYTSCLNLPIMVICALWGASYLKTVHMLSNLEASNVVMMIFSGSIIGCPLVGWLSDYFGKRKPFMIAGGIATLIAIMPLLSHDARLSPEVLKIIFFSIGFFSSTQVISYPLIAESNDSDSIGAATGIASVLIMGGAGVGQVLFGLLLQNHASSTTYTAGDFQYAMWMFPTAVLISLLAIFLARETNCKPLS